MYHHVVADNENMAEKQLHDQQEKYLNAEDQNVNSRSGETKKMR